MKRRLVVPAALVWLAFCVPLAGAGPLDACAQRVIRDWYSGGRVDKLYPLGCYRAAIRALPNDVLEYSDADKDIARALAFARKARTVESDDGARVEPAPAPARKEPAPEPSATTEAEPAPPVTETAPATAAPRTAPPAAPRPPRTTPAAPSRPPRTTPAAPSGPPQTSPPAPPERPTETAPRVAAGPEPADVSAAVPYPVIVLAALAATLLAMGGAGWLLSRRR